jgi:hypothetical protein
MIEAAIHEILASTSPAATAVTSLLPASRFVTGMQREQDLPYVTINLEANQSEYRSSDGSMRKPSIRFQLWIENHAAGCAIRDAIERLFENKSFNTTNHKLVQTRLTRDRRARRDVAIPNRRDRYRDNQLMGTGMP